MKEIGSGWVEWNAEEPLPLADLQATLAAQLKTLSQADRARLTRMLKEGG